MRSGRLATVRRAIACGIATLSITAPAAPAETPRKAEAAAPTCCDMTGTFEVHFTVKLDPSNHQLAIRLEDGRIVIVQLTPETLRLDGDRSAIITAEGTIGPDLCGLPLATGSATIVGIPGVTGRYLNLNIAGDEISGLLELGIGGELPGGQSICYEFTGTRDPNVPDPHVAAANRDLMSLLLDPRVNPDVALLVNLDLVVGNEVLRNDGTGGYFPLETLPLPNGHELIDTATGDFGNGPGLALLSGDSAKGGLRLLLAHNDQAADREIALQNAQMLSDSLRLVAGQFGGGPADDLAIVDGDAGAFNLVLDDGAGGFLPDVFTGTGSPFLGVAGDPAPLGDGRDGLLVGTEDRGQARATLFVPDDKGAFTEGPSAPLVCKGTNLGIQFTFGEPSEGEQQAVAITSQADGPGCSESGVLLLPLIIYQNPVGITAGAPTPVADPDPAGIAPLVTASNSPCGAGPGVIVNNRLYASDGAGGFEDVGSVYADEGTPLAYISKDVTGDGIPDVVAVENDPSGDGYRLRVLVAGTAELPPRPEITGVSVLGGKKLAIDGSGFDRGSTILVNGMAYKTKFKNGQLISKKGFKAIAPGSTAVIQVRSADGVVSSGVGFQRQ